MGGYVSLGHFDKKYFYILGSISVKMINSFIFGFTPYLTPNKSVFIFGFRSNFFSHPLIAYCFQYFSIFLGGLILGIIFQKKNKDIGMNAFENKRASFLELNSNKSFAKPRPSSVIENIGKDNYFKIIVIFSLFYFGKIACSSLDNMGYNRIKLWTLEFIFLYFFAKKIIHRDIYTHQKISLISLLFCCSIIYIINSFIPLSNKDCTLLSGDNKTECEMLTINIYNDIINKLGEFYIPIFILIYIFAMVSNAYSSIKSKWFMDIKYITIYKILLYVGGVGLIYSIILLIIISNIPCSENDIIHYICRFNYGGKLFYDNYNILSEIESNNNLYIDIFVIIPLSLLCSFLNTYFEFLIIRDLDPFYIIPIDSIFFLILEIIDYCMTYSLADSYRNSKFVCQILSNSIDIFFSCIYLEIIELHFCKLDLFIKKNIVFRGIEDINLGLMNELVDKSEKHEKNENSDIPTNVYPIYS